MASASAPLIHPAITVTKTSPVTKGRAGDPVAFVVKAENTGDDPLSAVQISDLPVIPIRNTPNRGDDGDSKLEPGETWEWDCSGPDRFFVT